MYKKLCQFMHKECPKCGAVFKFKIGEDIATGLTGFIAGVAFASILWLIAVYFQRIMMLWDGIGQ